MLFFMFNIVYKYNYCIVKGVLYKFDNCKKINCILVVVVNILLFFVFFFIQGIVIIIVNYGDRIDILFGVVLENKIVFGNFRILDY